MMPCSVTNETSELVKTAGKNDSRMNVARAGSSMDAGSPCPGNPMNRRASVKLETPATDRTASFQSGKDRAVAKGTGCGCLNSHSVETRYGNLSSKMFSASSVRPPHVEL